MKNGGLVNTTLAFLQGLYWKQHCIRFVYFFKHKTYKHWSTWLLLVLSLDWLFRLFVAAVNIQKWHHVALRFLSYKWCPEAHFEGFDQQILWCLAGELRTVADFNELRRLFSKFVCMWCFESRPDVPCAKIINIPSLIGVRNHWQVFGHPFNWSQNVSKTLKSHLA